MKNHKRDNLKLGTTMISHNHTTNLNSSRFAMCCMRMWTSQGKSHSRRVRILRWLRRWFMAGPIRKRCIWSTCWVKKLLSINIHHIMCNFYTVRHWWPHRIWLNSNNNTGNLSTHHLSKTNPPTYVPKQSTPLVFQPFPSPTCPTSLWGLTMVPPQYTLLRISPSSKTLRNTLRESHNCHFLKTLGN